MKLLTVSSALIVVGAQPGFITCSDNVAKFPSPSRTVKCQNFKSGGSYTYPDDFTYKNEVTWYTCPDSRKRIVVSNDVPNHDVKVMNPNVPCIFEWFVSMPLNGTLTDKLTEVPPAGAQAMQLNGVPTYGAQEDEGQNAVIGKGVTDAQYWYGHTSPQKNWHYHMPYAGHESTPTESTLIGYAFDGFPIFGETTETLDECNGRIVNNQYQYHIQSLDKVDGEGGYCDGTSAAIKWNYNLGCYHGDISKTVIGDAGSNTIPSDCVKDTTLMAQIHKAKHFGQGASKASWLVGSKYSKYIPKDDLDSLRSDLF